jgi:two-component system sensor histidine kinase KdpD
LQFAAFAGSPLSAENETLIEQIAQTACEHNQVIGFGTTSHLWTKAAGRLNASGSSGLGAYVPLRVKETLVGALHVGSRRDNLPFSVQEQRLILAFANTAAVVIARQSLADEAAQASALREADALKDALLSMVTHELRTPLAAIKAASSGLRQPHAVWSETARVEALETIDTEADRLTTLVSNLLDLSRLEAGAWNPSKDWCDLTEIVSTALDRLPESDAARVQITSPADLPLMRADYVQVALVLTNLLQNAAKYAQADSSIFLTLASDWDSMNHPGVRVDVRDIGEGIAPGDEEAIFARFYRSARHVGSRVHGTGLGLALCQAVVEAHGGRLWARNAPAGETPGAIFSFFLPIG